MSSLPTGTITFLFTDIEGSTKLWEQYPEQTRAALVRHDAHFEETVSRYHGDVVRPRGEGDSRFAVFSLATDAVAAAAAIQQALYAEPWTTPKPLRVRVALHTGDADLRDGDYYGSAVNRCARLRGAAHGGQTLLSAVTYGLVRDALPPGVQLRDMGEHRLKDLISPEHVFQLVVPELPSEFPPLKTLDSQPNNLPVQLTSLVGREREVEAVCSLLRKEDVHLLTLTGAGGTGKTRLSLQVGAELLEEYADGVWFVELAALTDHTLVVSEIAHTLGVVEEGGRPIVETLKDYLREKHLLLILDNFERVTQAAPQAGQLLQAAPQVKVLVTSRVPLRVRGEKEYPVPPLSIPDPRHLPSLDKLTQYEAVRLFVERATDVKPDFEVTNDNAPAVAEICVRLDGLPLAIELAAARVKMLPPEALLSRLSQRLKLLTGGAKDLPARQQTLRNTIEWSYDLLSGGEKQLFWRMAPFSGGRTLQALEEVCGHDGKLQIDVFDGVQSLLDKSLLQRRVGGGAGGGDEEPRFWMLETIHEYSREKLEESGEAEALYREHAQYYLRLVEEAEPHLRGARQLEWLDRLEEEHDNFRAVLDWSRKESIRDTASDAAEPQPIDVGLRLVGALYRFWVIRSRYSEGREQLRSILYLEAAKSGSATRRAARARALLGEALLANRQEDQLTARARSEEALTTFRELGDKQGIAASLAFLAVYKPVEERSLLLEESRALFEETGDNWNLARVLYQFGRVWYVQGDYELARHFFMESLALAQQAGDTSLTVLSLMDIGNTATGLGDYDTASTYWERSLALCRQVGDKWGTAVALVNLMDIAWMRGNATSMRLLAEEALVICREIGDVLHTALSLLDLGRMALIENDTARARNLVEESLTLLRQRDSDRSGEATALRFLGHIAKREGDAGKAARLYMDSVSMEDQTGYKQWDENLGVASTLAALGGLEEAAPTAEQGARLLGAAQALIDASLQPLDLDERIEYERSMATAHARMSNEAAWQASWEEGRAMSMEQAIEYALEERKDNR